MMQTQPAKPLLYALLLSLTIHLLLMFGTHLELPDWHTFDEPSTLTVELQSLPKPTPVALPAPKKTAPPPKPKPSPQPAPTPAPVATPAPPPEPEPTQAPTTPPEPQVATPSPPPAPVVKPNIVELKQFPAQMEVVYDVHRGEKGVRLGTTTHKWRNVNNQYLLTSSTEASGLFSLFFGGKYILTSRGEVTPQGIKPVSFWIQRGQKDNRTEYAEFNWDEKIVEYGKGEERNRATIQAGAQDQLSVFYQLALTAPHKEKLQFSLTTGRKFNQYVYQVAGEEILETAFGALRTQHLSRVTERADKSDAADVWLAIDHFYLPVRFRLATRDGEVLDHWMVKLRVNGEAVGRPADTP